MRILPVAVAAITVLGVGCGDGDDGAESSPGVQEPTTTAAPVTGTGRLDVGGQTYTLQLDECFATPDDGVRVRGATDDGHQVVAEYEPGDFDTAEVHVTDRDGVSVWASDTDDPPSFDVTEGGFTVRGNFTSDGGDVHDGTLSGTC